MGFYGNITNTSKTQFQFDRKYSNRYEMDRNKTFDGIYAGRYVLVEYDNKIQMGPEGNLDGNVYLHFTPEAAGNGFYKGKLEDGAYLKASEVEVRDIYYTEGKGTDRLLFYVVVPGAFSNGEAKFKLATASDANYVMNYNIDLARYGEGKGYDSTVWQKVYDAEKGELYVMIAELNSVVPTFDLSIDAPSQSPVAPHFDVNSTDVYYQMHVQPSWGLRVGKSDTLLSDEKTVWTRAVYDPETRTTKHQYLSKYSPAADNDNDPSLEWTDYDPEIGIDKLPAEVPCAIYYNKDALNEDEAFPLDNETENAIAVRPTGKSGLLYNQHDGSPEKQQGVDIQELTINLPAIGNMVATGWNIIHGPNRDDSTADSLQGRLNFFTKELKPNEIPVASGNHNYLVGSTFKGDKWLVPEVNTSAANEVYHVNGIKIKHIYNKKDSTASTFNVNGSGDTINLETTGIDEVGHVVCKNVETVTLPYGYKSFNSQNNPLKVTEAPSEMGEQIATNTQDSFNIIGSNKWSVVDTATEKTINIGHKLSDFAEGTKPNTDYGLTQNIDIASLDKANSFNVPCLKFDEAGHILKAETHTVKLPENFDKININGSSSNVENTKEGTSGILEADNLTDTMNISVGNKWIKMYPNPSEDSLIVSHMTKKVIPSKANKVDCNVSSNHTFTIHHVDYDEAGHIIKDASNSYTLPNGFKTITTTTNTSEAKSLQGIAGSVTAKNIVDKVTLAEGNKWVNIEADSNNNTVTLKHYLNDITTSQTSTDFNNSEIKNITSVSGINYDKAGHITSYSTQVSTLPDGFKTIKVTDSGKNVTNILTSSNGSIVADTLTDIAVLDTGNRWILASVDASKDTITLSHGSADSTNTTNTEVIDANPNFGDSFKVNDFNYDAAGHISSTSLKSITLPEPSLNSANYDNSTLITQLNLNSKTGAITQTIDSVGNLTLKGYKLLASENKISDSLSINEAFSSTQAQINKEINERTSAIKAETEARAKAIEKEVSDRDAAILVETNARVADMEQEVLDRDAAILVETNARVEAINKETENRNAAIQIETNARTQAIAQEASDRESAINTAIEKEIKERDAAILVETNARKTAITNLSYSNPGADNEYVSDVTQASGKIEVTRKLLPTLTTGSVNGTISFGSKDIAVKGLGDAAYTQASSYEASGNVKKAISELNYTNANLEANTYVYSVAESNGIISDTRKTLPIYKVTEGTDNGTIKINDNTDIKVHGLGSAAFTDATKYISKTDTFKYNSVEIAMTIDALFSKVSELETKVLALEKQLQEQTPPIV